MKRSVIVFSLLFLSFFTFLLFSHCNRDNPFDINSENYVPGKNPHVHFTDTLISGYLLDTVTLSVSWSDTATGGLPGIIKKCYIDWNGDGNFSDSLIDVSANPLVISKAFYPRENWVKIVLIDSEGDTSNIDSVWLEIKSSTPQIVLIQAPDTVKTGVPFTINVNATDTGGVITSYLWAVDENTFSRTTDSGSITLILDSVGEKTIQIKARDNKMVESGSRIVSVYVIDLSDSVGPRITFLSPLESDTIHSRQWVVSVQVVDQSGVGGVTLNDSITMQMVGSTWRGTVFLNDGENTLTISAVDTKGFRTEKQIKISVVLPGVDLEPPVVRLLAPVRWSDTISTSSLSVRMFVNDESGVTSVFFDGELLLPDSTDGSYSAERDLQEGINRFSIRSVDKKGNARGDTLVVFWEKEAIDSIPPNLTILEPVFMKHVFDTVAVIKGTVTDAGKVLSVTVNDTEAYLDYPFWRATVHLTKGINVLTIIATDNSVNRNTTEKQTFIVSNELPKFISNPLDTFVYLGANLTFSASVIDDDTGLGYTITRSQFSYGNVSPLISTTSGVTFYYTAENPGIDTFKLIAKDPWGDFTSTEWHVTALSLTDSAPRFTNSKLPETTFVSDTLRTAVHAVDPNGLHLIYAFKGQKPSGATIDSASGNITWIPAAGDTGKHEITLNVSNGLQESLYLWKISVLPKNRPPEFLPLGGLSVDENQRLLVVISATDPTNDQLDFSFGATFPDGAMLDSNKFSWTPTFADAGTHTIVFIVKESKRIPSLSDTQTVTITVNNVNQKPVLVNPGVITGVMNQLLTFSLSATDPDNDSITYVMRNTPNGAALTRNVFNWTPEPIDTGSHTIRFIASDSKLSDTIDVVIRINKENRAPVLTDPGSKSVNENQWLYITLSATDPDNDSLIYSMEDAPSGAQLQGRTFSWRPTYTQAGTYDVKFTVHDNVLPPLSSDRTVRIDVNNVNAPPVLTSPGNRSVNENDTLSFNLDASDIDGGILTYSMLNAQNSPFRNALDGKSFSWKPSFIQAGTYPVTFVVADNSNLRDSQTITITVRNVNRAPVISDTSLSVDENSLVSFQIKASDPDGPLPLKFTSSNLPSGAAIDINGKFIWTPDYTQAGNYPIAIIVQDTSNRPAILSDTATISIYVNNVNRAPSFTDSTLKNGTELQPLSFQLKATDPDNDQIVFSSNNLPGNSVLNNGVFFWTPGITDANTYNVTFIVRDTSAGTVSLRDTATIRIAIIDTIPAIPALLSPADNASAQANTVTFKWNRALSTATGYHFQISENAGFNTVFVQDSTLLDTVKTVSGLSNGTTYYWRVSAITPGAKSGWTSVRMFATVPVYGLTVNAINGTVLKNPDLVSYDSATVVTLKVQPAQGYRFTGWSGDLSGSADSLTIIMNAAKNIIANFTSQTYTLTLAQTSGGAITDPSTSTFTATHGIPVPVTATPDAAHRFVNWTASNGNAVFNNASSPTTSVTLTGGAQIQANFTIRTYQLTVNARTGGTITTPTSPVTVNHGVASTITASVSNGYTFAHWTVTSGAEYVVFADSTLQTTNVILTGDATVLACYTYTLSLITNGAGGVITTPLTTYAEYDIPVNIVAQPNSGYSFSHWTVVNGSANVGNLEASSTTVRLRDNTQLRANFTNSVFTLAVTATPHGNITAPSPATFTSTLGTVVLASAEAEPGYHFVEWIVLEGDPEITNTLEASTNIRVTGNNSVQAVFAINSYTVNATSAGNGTVSPATLNGEHGTEIAIQATADDGYHFSEWLVDGSFGISSLIENPAVVALTGDGTIQANFEINTYTIGVTAAEHGSIQDPLSGILSGEHNSVKTITAQAENGYHFAEWIVNGTIGISGLNANPATVTLTGDGDIQATFAINTYTIGVTAAEHGSIQEPLSGTLSGEHNSVKIITAQAEDGYHFAGWIVNGTMGISSLSTNPATVTLKGGGDIQATFAPNRHLLSVTTMVGGTLITPEQPELDTTYGSTVTITVERVPGYRFLNWTVVSGSATITDNNALSTEVKILDDNATILANFEELPTLTVSVSALPGGEILSPVPPTTVYYGDTIDIATGPLSETASFTGWIDESENSGSVKFVENSSSPTNKAVITGDAKIVATYSITEESQE
jgi:hypothetical protein